jgi:CheY-like chemotaxis protein
MVDVASPGRDQGSTFTVTLPLLIDERAALATTQRTTPVWESTDTATLAGMRVVVVDDELDACELLEAVLRGWGADVLAVCSARAAHEVLASFRPDVLMSDIGMPEEDGHALICQVRAREAVEGGHLLAVALSAFASPADREQAIALGFDAHLAKPASPEDVVRTVARLVGRAA